MRGLAGGLFSPVPNANGKRTEEERFLVSRSSTVARVVSKIFSLREGFGLLRTQLANREPL